MPGMKSDEAKLKRDANALTRELNRILASTMLAEADPSDVLAALADAKLTLAPDSGRRLARRTLAVGYDL